MEELLDCMICFERFVEPKILNCSHTYCCKCLDMYHRTNQITRRDLDSKRIRCPTCREATPWPENGAKDLRVDFKVTKIQELINSLKISSVPSSKSTQKIPNLENCGYCLTLNKNNPSSVYCITCEKSYCKDCQVKHRENPVFGMHSTISISKGTNGVRNISGLLSNNCEMHQKEVLKYVCITCNQAVCTLCLIDKHQKDDVKPIEQFLKNTSSKIKNLLSEVGSRKDDLKLQLEELEPEKVVLVKACVETEKLIKKRSEILINEVKKQEADLISQVQKRQLSPVVKEIERLNFHLTKIKCIEQMANDKTMTLNKCLIIYPILIQRMQTLLDVDFKKDHNFTHSSPALKFTPGINQLNFGKIDDQNKNVRTGMQKSTEPNILESPLCQSDVTQDLKRLENPLRRASKMDASPDMKGFRNPLQKSIKFDSSTEVDKSENVKRKPSSVGFSSIRMVHKIYMNGSKAGEISKAMWLAELGKNMFVVSDCGNKRIQIFQTSGKVISVIDNELNPMGIAVTAKRNILITDCIQKLMQVFCADGKFHSKWGAGKFFSPCDLAVCPNGDIIVSDLGDNTVSLYKTEAKKAFCLGLTGSEDMRFKEPRYVTSGPNNEIIISDCKDHKIKMFDNKGHLMATMGNEGSKDGELLSPNGVCYTSEGQIVVADTKNNRLSTFSRNGCFLGNLQVDVTSPRDVIQVGKNTLVVSEYDSSTDLSAIKIFDMS